MIEIPQAQGTIFNPVYILWFWCPVCMVREEQMFIKDDGIYEIYKCQGCKCENRKAVR